MWLAWDMAAEMCLLQLPDLLSGEGGKEYQPSPFFRQGLVARRAALRWLGHGGQTALPCALCW
jgi:regulator-associated protein of mTOR